MPKLVEQREETILGLVRETEARDNDFNGFEPDWRAHETEAHDEVSNTSNGIEPGMSAFEYEMGKLLNEGSDPSDDDPKDEDELEDEDSQ